MLIPDDDDYYYDLETPDEYIIDHYNQRLYCKLCRGYHFTSVKGPLPENLEVPCYPCWSRYYAPVLAKKTEPVKEPEKVAAPRAVADASYDWCDDLAEAYGFFGFGI